MPNSKKSAATASTASVDPAIDPVSRFEGSLKELEAIVARMERGDLPLEESLIEFERGIKLSRDCRASLESAELRVKNLLDADRDAADPEADA